MRSLFVLLCTLALACDKTPTQPVMVDVREAVIEPPNSAGNCMRVWQVVEVFRDQEPVCKFGKLERVALVDAMRSSAYLRVDCGCVDLNPQKDKEPPSSSNP